MPAKHPIAQETVVGYFVVPETKVYRNTYECAAWYRDIEIPAGRYPIVFALEPWVDTWRHDAFRIRLKGKVVASCFDSLWCGNLISAKRNEDVGQEDTHLIMLDAFTLTRYEGVELLPEFQALIVCHGRYSRHNYETRQDEPSDPMFRVNIELAGTPFRTRVDGDKIHVLKDGVEVGEFPVGIDLRPVFADYGVRI